MTKTAFQNPTPEPKAQKRNGVTYTLPSLAKVAYVIAIGYFGLSE